MKMITALFFLLLFSFHSVFAAGPVVNNVNNNTVQLKCKGYGATSGEIVVSVDPQRIAVSGGYITINGTRRNISVACLGQLNGVTNGDNNQKFGYYQSQKDLSCPADYIRIDSSFFSQKMGRLALVDRTGGDNHDWSGYAYEYFVCGNMAAPNLGAGL